MPTKAFVPHLLLLSLVLGLRGLAVASPPAGPPTGRPLAEALNPDGTLRPGANGSYDARAFRMVAASDGRPMFRPAGVGDKQWQGGFGLPNGADGTVHAVVRSGTDTYIGGSFTAVGNVAANNIARWNGKAWSCLGTGTTNGVDGTVYALAVAGNGGVYTGGNFTHAGGIAANWIAKWNGTTWSVLGVGTTNGVNGTVTALAVAGNGDVYAGGEFTQAGKLVANHVARWTGRAWSFLGAGAANGVNDYVNALAVTKNGDVYAGGRFTQAGGASAGHVARWNGTAWSALGTGTDGGRFGYVDALVVAGNGDVYAGGDFTTAGGTSAINIAKWNGTVWSPLGTGLTSSKDLSNVVALAVADNGDVYAGGWFTQAGGVTVNHVARWNGTAWSALGTGTGSGLDQGVYALMVAGNGDIYAGGDFTKLGKLTAHHVAKWNSTVWSPLGTGTGNGLGSNVYVLAVAGNGDVYAGGEFTQAGGVAVNRIAKWNGTVWSPLGAGTANGVDGYIRALVVAGNGDVYAGGSFTKAGGMSANNIARWNGKAWSSLGAGTANGVNGTVNALAVAGNGVVYAGGEFSQAGGVAAHHVAKWNGKAWRPLGMGTAIGENDNVYALALTANGTLYMGGSFTAVGNVAANNIARWNGKAWSPLGAGITGSKTKFIAARVAALAVAANGDVYVGGWFTQAGGTAADNIAKWNGKGWSALGAGTPNGVNNFVQALAVAGNGNVFAGGQFTQAGGVAANRIAKWNGRAWSVLGTATTNGVNETVYTLVVGGNGGAYAGGHFTLAGGTPANKIAKWNGTD